MKKFLRLLPIVLMGMTLMTTSCKEDDEESCSKNDDNIGTCLASDITICCDDNQSCYYLYKGTKYQTATDLAKVCAETTGSFNEILIQLDEITAGLIENAKAAAVCR